MVQVQGLSKVFKTGKETVRAVDDVTFEAHPGKVFGLLGANGAGKTTTLRMLSTVIPPSSGTASVNGFDVRNQAREVRQSIGFLSTSTALYGRLPAREMLEVFGDLYQLGRSRTNSRIEELTEKLKLHEFLNRPCDKLSTGQKQRVSIARSILHDPPVVFFDEPTAGLDVVTSQTILEFIEESRTAGKTVVFSTHIMSEAERLCDHIAIIHQGKLRASGTLQELYSETGETRLERAFLKLVEYRSEVRA
jgi:sodium transport system ATP-binding protein